MTALGYATGAMGRRWSLIPWQRHLGLLGLALAGLAILSAADIADIGSIWMRTGAFHHCVLLPPILGWLVWQRRGLLGRLTPEFALSGCVLVAMGAVLWLVGAAGYVALLRQAAVVLCAQGLVVALLGLPVTRALLFPLSYMLFLIPAGSEFEPWLQTVTARIAVMLLHASGTPALLDGVFIATPVGLFRVAEACSGTGFLLAMAAYALLVCNLCVQKGGRRIAFFAVAMLAAILANGLRAYAVMEVASLTSMHNPIVENHLLYGWLLFASVLLLLMLAASPWFDRTEDDDATGAAILQGVPRSGAAAPVLIAVAALLLLPRLWLGATDAGPATQSAPPRPPEIVGWNVGGGAGHPPWHPHFTGATWLGQWHYADRAGEGVDLALIIFDHQREGQELVGYGQDATTPDGIWATAGRADSPPGGRGEWLRGPHGATRYVATFYFVDGIVTGSRIVAKLAAVRARLLNHPRNAAAILLCAQDRSDAGAIAIVDKFLRSAGPLEEVADRAHPIR